MSDDALDTFVGSGPDPTNEQIADTLDGAADNIEKFGWVQGSYGDRVGGYCALGGIIAALNYKPFTNELEESGSNLFPATRDFLGDVLRRGEWEITLPGPGQAWPGTDPVPVWNDYRYRTKQQVLDTLRYAAKEARRT